MASIPNLSALINRVSGGSSGTPESLFVLKSPRIGANAAPAPIAGQLYDMWQMAGSGMQGGAIPGASPVTYTNASLGALGQTNPGGGREKWMTGVMAACTAAGTIILYDRLCAVSELNATTITPQSVALSTPARASSYIGVQIAVDIYDIIGATGTTITASYTNQANTSGRTTAAATFGGTGRREIGCKILLPLAAGDTGVKSVESVTVLATTATAGNFGVSLYKPYASLPIPVLGTGNYFPYLTNIPTDACLTFAFLPVTTTTIEIISQLNFVEA